MTTSNNGQYIATVSQDSSDEWNDRCATSFRPNEPAIFMFETSKCHHHGNRITIVVRVTYSIAPYHISTMMTLILAGSKGCPYDTWSQNTDVINRCNANIWYVSFEPVIYITGIYSGSVFFLQHPTDEQTKRNGKSGLLQWPSLFKWNNAVILHVPLSICMLYKKLGDKK